MRYATDRQISYLRKLVESNADQGSPEAQAQLAEDLAPVQASLVKALSGSAAPQRDVSRAIDILRAYASLVAAEALNDVVPATDDDVRVLVGKLGRKAEASDISPEVQAWACDWVLSYKGDFSYIHGLRPDAAARSLTAQQAKGVVNTFAAAERRKADATSANGTEVTPGVYWSPTRNAPVKVQESKAGRLYAKVHDGSAWVYEGTGPIREGLETITAEQAKAFGDLTSRCIFCSLELEDERSTTVGYGPVCAAKNGLPWGDS